MKVRLNNEEQEEVKAVEPKEEAVSDGNPVNEPEVTPVHDSTEDLRIELAELRGRLSQATEEKRAPAAVDTEKLAIDTKNRVIADANNMDEDQFQQMYKMTKLNAIHSVNQYDLEQEKSKNANKIAELEAKNELISKYPGFAKMYDKVKSGISDLSPEARKDPARLAKAMEKEFLFVAKDDKDTATAPKREGDMNRKRISNDFERPTIQPNRSTERKEEDLVAAEDRQLAARFGITKESDRKKFSSPFIPMDLGTDMRDGKKVVFDGSRKEPYKIANS